MKTSTRHMLDVGIGSGTGLLWGLFLSDQGNHAINIGLAIATVVFFVEMYIIFVKK